MKRKNAFTLVELLVVIVIVFVTGLIAFSYTSHSDQANPSPFLFPREAQAQATQRLADEMVEQNRLMREMLSKQNRQ